MWRHDAARSAATDQQLSSDLHLQWVRECPPLEPAWPDEPRMRFDASYQPVVLGKTVFVASPRSDHLLALDTDTGNEGWRFYADGPIRFAPVAWRQRIYFSCDDGCLYCLSATDGTLLWKFQAAPSSRKVLGNGRLISSWPARGAPVIVDETAYFAAGIWPFMGIFIYALDAQTGELLWVNDCAGSVFMPQPHGGALAFAGVAPQGYMVAVGERLIVPNGRAVPAVFDRNTGEMLYFHLAESKYEGNFAASATSGLFFNSGRVFGLEAGTPPGVLPPDPIPTEDAIYAAADGSVVAYDPRTAQVVTETTDDGNERSRLEVDILWQAPAEVDRLWLKAGSVLLASAGQTVKALSLSEAGVAAEAMWQAELPSTPSAMAAADGKLFVVTLDGTIRCYGPREGQPVQHALRREAPDVAGAAVTRAGRIIDLTGATAGYCLCLGLHSGDLIAELARQSDLHIIGVDPRAERIAGLRERFDAAGLYGTRIALLHGQVHQVGLPPYLASLIVSEDPSAVALDAERPLVTTIFRSLRPYGGTACLALPEARHQGFASSVAASDLPNAQVTRAGEFTLLTRQGRLPGSDDWTHQYANVANTGVSRDVLVKAPLGLLWFGGSSNVDILPRHGHGPPEQVIGGRLFIEGPDSLRANDVYTGRVIWRRELPGFGAVYDYTGHQPGANALGSNYASAADGVYVAYGDRCLRLDPATGETLSELVLPPADNGGGPQQWGYIGIWEDLLIAGASPVIFEGDKPPGREENWDATSSRQIVVMDRHSGQVLWTHDSTYCFRHNAICAGSGKLFCVDRLPDAIVARMKRRGEELTTSPRLAALDIRTGELLWSTTADVFGTFLSYSAERDLLLQSGRPSRDMLPDEPGDRMIAYRGADGSVVWDAHHQYGGPPLLHGDTIITQGQAFSLLDGRPRARRNPLTGAESPWRFERFYGCNTAIASEHLLTFRSGAAGFFDLARDGGTGNMGGFKSGCTSNLIVANGVLNAPDYTRTCTCSYQNQTSLGLVHMPDAEMWTFNNLSLGDQPVARMGLNLGAPGDRRADDGTLWLEYPTVGGPSPELRASVSPEEVSWFRRHSSALRGGRYEWVGASGAEGLARLTITLTTGDAEPRPYAVTLYFAEPEDIAAGDRVFSVALQGRTVLEDFDVVAAAGGRRRVVTRQFAGIEVADDLTVDLAPTQPDPSRGPILCGVEVVSSP
ncbi:MAG: PQQ-binding-like beta-propeller repeat protein [Armatimonadota bacterium]|nr:PQQ-binding-like beta-propeller repeat protein [Armatimonadota bacterium]